MDVFNSNSEKLSVEHILQRSTKFGVEEYNKLSESMKNILRYDSKKVVSPQETKKLVYLGMKLEGQLDKKYGKTGYKLVSLGQSPNALSNILKIRGRDTSYLPGSNFNDLDTIDCFLKYEYLGNYKDYMKKEGIDANSILKNKDKTYVFVDYCKSGRSLANVEKFLKNEKMGLDLPNVEFKSLNELLKLQKGTDEEKFFMDLLAKDFSTGQKFYWPDMKNIESIMSKELSEEKKIAQFFMIDELEKQGKLSR